MATFRGMDRKKLGRRGGRPGCPAVERLESRSLLNASIDIAADGSLLYRSDPAAAQSLTVSRLGGVYTFAVDPGDAPIDVASNAAGLTVTGTGTPTVTVAGPSSLRIVAASDGQAIDVQRTGVATTIDIQADGASVSLGDSTPVFANGIRELAAPITVSAAPGTTSTSLTILDRFASHDPADPLVYQVSATTITAQGIDGFAGVTYSGLSSLTLMGTGDRLGPSALYLITGTADGTATTIDGSDGALRRDFSIVGMSSDPSSRLTLLSAGEADVYAAYIGSPTIFAGGSRSSIWIEEVRDATLGLNSSFIVDAEAGGVEVNVGPYWSEPWAGAETYWMLQSGSEGLVPFSRLQNQRGAEGAGLFYRPDQVEKLGVDVRGGWGGTLLVDFRGGDPIPAASPAWGRGLVYVGTSWASPTVGYSLAFVETPPGGAFEEELHVAMPLYRGAIELTKPGGSRRYVSYQLAEGAPGFYDGVGATSYRWTDQYYGLAPTARADSDLALTPGDEYATADRQSLAIVERNPGLRMAPVYAASKRDVAVLRGSVPGETTTTVDYGSWGMFTIHPSPPPSRIQAHAPPGLERLSVENASPNGSSPQLVRLITTPRDVATSVIQGPADEAVVRLAGASDSTSTILRGGGPGKLYVDASGASLTRADFVDAGGGWTRMASPTVSTPIDFEGYAGVEAYNPLGATPIAVDGLAFTTDAGQAHVDVAAAVLTTGYAGASAAELSATIEWGDGAVDYAAFRPVPGAPGSFQIVGSHVYAAAGVAAPNAWVAGQVVEVGAIRGLPITFHLPIVPTRVIRPTVTVSIPYPAYAFLPPWEPYPYTNQARPTLEGISQLGEGSRVDVYAVSLGAGAASASVVALGTATVGADSRWSLVSGATLADGVYDLYAISTSDGLSQGVGRGRVGGITINTQGPQITAVDVDPRAGTVSVRVRAWVPTTWSLPADSYLVAADGRPLPIVDIEQIERQGGTPHEYDIWVKTDGPLAPGEYSLTLPAAVLGVRAGVFEFSGNALDGAFDGTFPSGGSNTGQDFRARLIIGRGGRVQVLPV